MLPEPGGAVVLRVNIRSVETIQWYKNGIALKEGADGGRVKGVTTNTLTFGKLLPRDQGVKVWAAGKNKWGKVETTPCELMVRPPHCAPPCPPCPRSGAQSCTRLLPPPRLQPCTNPPSCFTRRPSSPLYLLRSTRRWAISR